MAASESLKAGSDATAALTYLLRKETPLPRVDCSHRPDETQGLYLARVGDRFGETREEQAYAIQAESPRVSVSRCDRSHCGHDVASRPNSHHRHSHTFLR